MLWALDYAPEGWAFCNGQLLDINNHQALYALIGNTYGGRLNENFALPDLRSRVPIGAGQGTGLTNVNLAAEGGSENASLIKHTHVAQLNNLSLQVSGSMSVSSKPATQEVPNPHSSIAAIISSDGSAAPTLTPALGYNTEIPDMPISGLSITSSSSSSANASIMYAGQGDGYYANMQPFLALNYIICVYGVYPVRP